MAGDMLPLGRVVHYPGRGTDFADHPAPPSHRCEADRPMKSSQ
jgi:hypothetical protein